MTSVCSKIPFYFTLFTNDGSMNGEQWTPWRSAYKQRVLRTRAMLHG